MELTVQDPPNRITEEPKEGMLENQKHVDSRLKIEETLEDFGMLRNEIKVYLYLAEEGAKKAKDICEALNIHRTETYCILHHLEKKGLVYAELEKPVKFFAVPLDKGIDSLVEVQRTKIQMLQNQKDTLVSLWTSIPQQKHETMDKCIFQKLEGEQRIIIKASELLQQTKAEFKIFVTDEYLAELYYSNFFDELKRLTNKLDIALLTTASAKSKYFVEKIRWPQDKHYTVNGNSLPCFIISDGHELLMAFSEEEREFDLAMERKERA